MTTVEELQKAWSYEFKEWQGTLLSQPVRLVISEDKSESYEMDRFHVFELENGKYAAIRESGCSCYSSSDADITIYPTELEAIEPFLKWKRDIETRGY